MSSSLRNRVVICGDSTVGKTNILERIKGEHFADSLQPTQIANYFAYPYEEEEEHFDINFWDVGGDVKMRRFAEFYFNNIEIAILVIDNTNHQTFDTVAYWINLLKDKSPSAMIMLAVNKSDSDAAISEDEISNFLISSEVPEIKYIRISAKTGQGIDHLIHTIGHECIGIRNKKKVQALPIVEPDPNGTIEVGGKCCTVF